MARQKKVWFIVDDQREADAFCATFSQVKNGGSGFSWEWLTPSVSEDLLLKKITRPIAGILIDIDLTNDSKMKGTGLGLAQNIRAKQKNKSIPEYPLARFANDGPVRKFVGRDPGSNDLFDLLISKESATKKPKEAVDQCIAVRDVYDKLSGEISLQHFASLCGIKPRSVELWVDARLIKRINAGLSREGAVHVGAGTFIRSFLEPNGILIDESLLAVRLGVDTVASGRAWPKLLEKLDEYRYRGIGENAFKRWWARGIEAFWYSIESSQFLQELSVEERVKTLSLHFKIKGLKAFEEGKARYWRLCTLSAEVGKAVPVDPRDAVTMSSAVSRDPWLEPLLAAPAVALMHKTDTRLNPEDLARFMR